MMARDLMIDALSAASPGIAVENPRQIPSYRYARRYGPRPPCFARATLLSASRAQSGTNPRRWNRQHSG